MSKPIVSADSLALEQQVGFALPVATRKVLAVYRPLLEPMGLTYPQYLVMLALWQRAPMSVRQLSELLQLDPGTLSPLLKRLETMGYVRRQRDRADERNLAVTVTPWGEALRDRARKIPPALVDQLGVPAQDLQRLHAALTQIISGAQPDPPQTDRRRPHGRTSDVGAAATRRRRSR